MTSRRKLKHMEFMFAAQAQNYCIIEKCTKKPQLKVMNQVLVCKSS